LGALGHADAPQIVDVIFDASEKRQGNLLTVSGLSQEMLGMRVREKGNLSEDGGHVCANQDHERGFPHAAVVDAVRDPGHVLEYRAQAPATPQFCC